MNIKESDLIQDVMISWSSHRQQFYSKANLMIEGYTIELENQYFDTIDEAVANIKERVAKAVTTFEPLSK